MSSLYNINPSLTVAFSGYRPDKIKKSDPNNNFLFAEIQARLLGTIHKLAEQGYKTFLSGMAAGFDLMAASAVLLARNTYPEIELICVVPFPDQAFNFAPYWKVEHSNILRQAQRNITLFGSYHRSVYHRRNDFLIENSSILVCYYDGQPWGTHYTVTAARKQGLNIENLCQTEKASSPLIYKSK
ncbi:MAG: DUF1273 domain-containing protein [Rikenellaceae bacterium]|nr:DUF1273 domain-containing protein [Rikenellaceae bacterium]